jgi:DNA-binding response OmpR family regulator
VRSLLRRRKTNHNLEEQCFAELTPTEAILLAYLALNWDRVITTPGLITEVWGGKKVTQNSLKLYIHRLRRKLDGRFHLINCPGVGYRLIQPIPDQVEELAGSPTPLSEGARQSQAEVKGLWD